MSKRSEFVEKAKSWIGTKEGSAGHKQIVADYNKACDAGRKADAETPWCALFVGAVAEETGNVLQDGIGVPVDISCGTGSHSLIEKAKAAGIWVENDAYTPNKDGGDIIIYDWNDNGKGDDTTGHDHTGVILSVGTKNFKVAEGNKNKAVEGKDGVGTRTVEINGKYIRGFICPRFADEVEQPQPEPEKPAAPEKSIDELAREVIAGTWGNDPERKAKLIELYGEDGRNRIQARVNEILKGQQEAKPAAKTYRVRTNSGLPLRLRAEPNINSEKLCTIANGTKITVTETRNGWAKTTYAGKTGWCSMTYLK